MKIVYIIVTLLATISLSIYVVVPTYYNYKEHVDDREKGRDISDINYLRKRSEDEPKNANIRGSYLATIALKKEYWLY
jgi:hypothetical protein